MSSFVDLFGEPLTPAPKIITEPAIEQTQTPVDLNVLQSQSAIHLTKKTVPELDNTKVMLLWRKKPKYFFRDVMDVTLDLWQEEVVELYVNNQRIGMIASKGPGKEQPVSTKMYTPKGEVRFGDLKVGDEVFSRFGTPTKVTAVYPQGIKDVYKVTFDDGSSTECGLEHLWKVNGFHSGRTKSWKVVSLREMLERGLFVTQGSQTHHHYQLPRPEPVEFSRRDLPIDPYLLGVWIGDGSANKGSYTSIDDEIQKEITSRGYKTKKSISKERAPTIKVEGLLDSLKKLGISKNRSFEKSIPEIYKTSSINQRIDLLKGLMDTDGTIDKIDGSCEFDTSSLSLAKDVMWLVRSLGGKSTIRSRVPKLKNVEHRVCYRVRVTTPFAPFNLERKYKFWKLPSQDRYFARTIKKVELVRKEESMCITVACPEHCYLTNDFIITHNTAVLAMLGLHMFTTNHRPKIAALSISKDHLMSNLWAEMLMRIDGSEYLKGMVSPSQSRIALKGAEGISFIDARSFPKSADASQMASTLAGLHADNVGFLIDEAGRIPDAVLNTADAALAGGDGVGKMARLIVAANPEDPSGLLYRASRGETIQKWAIYRVNGDPDNPKRAPRVSINWAREQIAQYGRDNPWVLVNVFGQYPKHSASRLLSEAEVMEAMQRKISLREVRNSQSRGSLDVARGGIDFTVFTRRKGLLVSLQEVLSSSLDGPELAGIVRQRHAVDPIENMYIDNTGGFGSSVYDCLKHDQEMQVIPLVYNSKAQDDRYYNRRAEMYFRLRDFVRAGGCLPYCEMLKEELCAIEYTMSGGKIILLDKEQIKAKIGRSPDRGDSVAQTFADVEMSSNLHGDFDIYGNPIDNKGKYYSRADELDDDFRNHNRFFSA